MVWLGLEPRVAGGDKSTELKLNDLRALRQSML